MEPHERIIFALDFPALADASKFLAHNDLFKHVGMVKIGLELFIAAGPTAVASMPNPVMLDLKIHDIPETVERAVLRAGDLGIKFLTLHVQQRETMRRAVKAAEKSGIQLLGVTVLTSMTDADLHDFCIEGDTFKAVLGRAVLAYEEGITGFVTSPREAGFLRKGLGPKPLIVVPGIRPEGTASGDQARVGVPKMAIQDGGDFLVVGRPIRDAEDPIAMADRIANEIGEAGPGYAASKEPA